MCAVPNMALVCSSLISCCVLLRYCLNDFEMVSIAPVITGITFAFTFHMHDYNIYIGGRIILGWISRRWDVGMWTGSGWPRIGTGGGRL